VPPFILQHDKMKSKQQTTLWAGRTKDSQNDVSPSKPCRNDDMAFGKLKQKFQNENGEENVPDVYRLYDNASVNIKDHVRIVERRVKEM